MNYHIILITLCGLLVESCGIIQLDKAGIDQQFDGIGGISAGASTRLLLDYPKQQQGEILDYLFKPNYGASLQILKVEIGCDAQSTGGSESSHMRTNTTVDAEVGYEWWLFQQAKARNPDIKLYGLPWGFPGWVANDPITGERNDSAWVNQFTHIEQPVRYIIEWVRAAKEKYGLLIDYLGILNESIYNDDYIKLLRQQLDVNGFSNTRLVATDGGTAVCQDMSADPELSKAIDFVGLHYPSDFSGDYRSYCPTGQRVWASEDFSSYNDVNGAACWARLLASHYVRSGITGSHMWSLVGAYYPGFTWFSSGMFTAVQPWTGHYQDIAPVWATAHVTQFTQIGWHYLKNESGSGLLPQGGYYTTIVDSQSDDFTLNIVKISYEHAACVYQYDHLPDSEKNVSAEKVIFQLDPSMGSPTSLALWRSNFQTDPPILFEQQTDVQVVNGEFSLSVDVGDYYTVSTIRTAKKGNF